MNKITAFLIFITIGFFSCKNSEKESDKLEIAKKFYIAIDNSNPLEMDKLKLVVAKLSMLAERQLNYLLNSKLNDKLTPFVNLGKLGLNFGMQGAQFTATSTTAENQMLSNPMYIHSIPNNNDNQDIVSMGTNSALITKKVIENTFEVLSIEIITIVQAIELLGFSDKVSSATKKLYDEIRAIVPPFKEDLIMYPFINEVKEFLINSED